MSDMNSSKTLGAICWFLALPFFAVNVLFYFRPENFITSSLPSLHTTHPWLFSIPGLVGAIRKFLLHQTDQ